MLTGHGTIVGKDNVVHPQIGMVSGAVFGNRIDQHALGEVIFLGIEGVNGHHRNADARPHHVAGGDKFFYHLHGIVKGDSIADALGVDHVAVIIIACIEGFGAGDADDPTLHIQQRAAAGAGIDGRVGLQIAVDLSVHIGFSGCGADDAEGGRIRQLLAGGVADGHGKIPHPYPGAGAQGKGGQVIGLNFEHRHIQLGIRAHHLGLDLLLVCKLNHYPGGILYHMGVGYDIAFAGNHKAAAVRAQHILASPLGSIVDIQAYHALLGMLHDIGQGIYSTIQRGSLAVKCGQGTGNVFRRFNGFGLRILGRAVFPRAKSVPFPFIAGDSACLIPKEGRQALGAQGDQPCDQAAQGNAHEQAYRAHGHIAAPSAALLFRPFRRKAGRAAGINGALGSRGRFLLLMGLIGIIFFHKCSFPRPWPIRA